MSTSPSTVWVSPPKLRPSRWNAEFYRRDFIDMEEQLVNSPYTTSKLRELAQLFTGPFGSKLPACIYKTQNGIPLLRVQNIIEFFLNETDMAYIPQGVHEKIIRSKLESGDLALAKAGRLGALSRIPNYIPQCNITQHIVGIRVNKEKVSPDYIAAFFLSKFGKFQLERQGVGTIIKYLGIEETRDALIPLPELPIQLFIGVKVELAERCQTVVRECESIVSSVFYSYWKNAEVKLSGIFYAWTPVELLDQDRIEPSFYRPDLTRLHQIVMDNKHGCARIGDFAEVIAGKTPKSKSLTKGNAEIVRVANLTGEGLNWSDKQFVTIDSNNHNILHDGDIVVCKDAHQKYYIGKQVDIYCRNHHCAVASSETLVIRFDKTKVNPFVVLMYLRSISGYAAIQQQIRGTSAHLYPSDVKKILVPLLPESASLKIEQNLRNAEQFRICAYNLIDESKTDIEALIEGKLDTGAILSGKLTVPQWEDIEKELKER